MGTVRNNQYTHEKNEFHEIHRVPYESTLRDKVGNDGSRLLRKGLSFFQLVKSFLSDNPGPDKAILNCATELLRKDPEIKTVIVSGRPFTMFRIGYLLRKQFPIRWIPDYRDEWTTHKNPANTGFLWNFIHRLEKRAERKWTSNADFFTSVSEPWVQSIGAFIGKPGHVIMNGYTGEVANSVPEYNDQTLRVLYAGTLYPAQEIEVFINAAIRLIHEKKGSLEVRFIGINIVPSEEQRLRQLTRDYPSVFFFEDRKEKSKVEEDLEKADVLLLTSFRNVKGWLPVKMFDYYRSGKTVLLCPGDSDVMDRFVEETICGVSVDNEEKCFRFLEECLSSKNAGKALYFARNLEKGAFYSREYQTQLLAKVLDGKNT